MSEMQLITDLVVHQDNINSTALNVLEMWVCQAILEDTERLVATIKAKREENGGLGGGPPVIFLGSRPLECLKAPF